MAAIAASEFLTMGGYAYGYSLSTRVYLSHRGGRNY
jgi:hypothetical protein